MTYDTSLEVTNKEKVFLAEHTVHDSALETQQKQSVKRAQFYRFRTLNFVFGGRLSPGVGSGGLASVI